MHDTAVWVEYESTGCCDPGNYCIDYYETIWLMQGDTFVNNLTYKKLFFEVIGYWSNLPQSGCITCGFWSDGVFWQPYLFGLIREDSTKKVYCLTTWDEVMLYDFNLQVGDTFRFGNSFFSQYAFVADIVDSITLMNGEKRKHISLNGGYEEWIEGIGSTRGLFDAFCDVFLLDFGTSLLCFNENGIQKFQNPNFTNCFYTNLGINENKTNFDFQISPNPSSTLSELNFNLAQADCLTIKLVELSGKTFKTIAPSNFHEGEHKIKLDVSALESGIYFIQIQGQKYTAIEKLVVIK